MGRLCSGGFSFSWENVIFAAYFILRVRDTHIVFLRLLFLVGVICPLMQEHSLRLKKLISQAPEYAMLKIRRPVYKRLFKSNRVLRADLLSLSAPSPRPLTRSISSSLREFQHGAFASKNIRAPKQNACTAGKNINWFGEVSFDIQVYSTSICSLVFTKIQSSLLQNQIVSVIKFWVRNNYDWKKEPILNNFIPYTTRPPQWGFIGLPTAPF